MKGLNIETLILYIFFIINMRLPLLRKWSDLLKNHLNNYCVNVYVFLQTIECQERHLIIRRRSFCLIYLTE